MGFRKEFDRAKDWIVSSLTFRPASDRQCGLSVFESTIRVLGGLLAAHDLSGETAFVSKAEELARALEPAYDTPLFFPRSEIGKFVCFSGRREDEREREGNKGTRKGERKTHSLLSTSTQKNSKNEKKQSSNPGPPAPLSGLAEDSPPCSPRSAPSRWNCSRCRPPRATRAGPLSARG